MPKQSEFLKGVFQIDADFKGEPAKVPVFYYDARAITAIFFAKMSVLRKFLPKKEYHPLPLVPGIGAIAITCFEYHDTDIRPYNELSITIPMSFRRKHCLPAVKMLSELRCNELNVYIHHLPVTTEIALNGGVIVYNYPKFMSTIKFEDTKDELTVTLAEKDEMILKLRARKIPANTEKVLRYVTYPVMESRAQHADVLLHAKKYGQTFNPNSVTLELGAHKISKELKEAIVWSKPMMYQYIPEFESILYGPNRLE